MTECHSTHYYVFEYVQLLNSKFTKGYIMFFFEKVHCLFHKFVPNIFLSITFYFQVIPLQIYLTFDFFIAILINYVFSQFLLFRTQFSQTTPFQLILHLPQPQHMVFSHSFTPFGIMKRYIFIRFNLFNCYLAVPRPTFSHDQRGSLTHLMLITAFLHIRPDVHRESRNEVGSLSPAEGLVEFSPGTFPFSLRRLNPLGYSPHQATFPGFQNFMEFQNIYIFNNLQCIMAPGAHNFICYIKT